MRPYYDHAGITIYHCDCREVLTSLGRFDLLLTDPPYGINWVAPENHQDAPWRDDEGLADLTEWLRLTRCACVWGGNYYTEQLKPSESWLIWVKRPLMDFQNDPRTFSTIEMAWSNFGGKPRYHVQVWDGGKRAGDPSNRSFCHPAQKPYELMKWCLTLAADCRSVVDPFMGSGTTLRAAKDCGMSAVGIDREEKYCEIAARRLSQEVLPLAL